MYSEEMFLNSHNRSFVLSLSALPKTAILIIMIRTILVILYMSSMSFLLGCDGGGNGAEAKTAVKTGVVNEKQAAASAGTLFAKEITKQPCDLLTPNAVAAVAGVDQSALEQNAMASMCLYSWDGGQAHLSNLRTSKKVEFARERFENSYRNQTGEEVAQGMAKIDAELEKQKDEGKTEVDPQQAKVVTGAMSGMLSGGLQYEDIPGLGDIARFEITRTETQFGGKTFVSYANALNVLTGNLKFTVSFSRDGEPKLYRDESVALAEAVLEKLPD